MAADPGSALQALSSYLGRHWRGEQSVVRSLLVNGVLVGAAIGIAAGIALSAGVAERTVAMFGAPIYLAWLAWASVGMTRAAIATIRNPEAHWALKVTAIVIFVIVVWLLLAIFNDLPIVRAWLLSMGRPWRDISLAVGATTFSGM
jgi:hypothetical protein